jgi:hypothetical protein
MNAHGDLSVDTCVAIRETCPVEYVTNGKVIEFHYGGPNEGFHFEFDVAARCESWSPSAARLWRT